MKTFFKKVANSTSKSYWQNGFTLVELMVVVAIIALLAATALPQFRKYQAKSRVSEARLGLASTFTALESFYAEYNHYHTCLGFMGYIPTGANTDRYFSIGFSNSTAVQSNLTPQACTATAVASSYAYAGTKVPGGVTALGTANITYASLVGHSIFMVEAVGVVDKDYANNDPSNAASAARLTINSDKTLLQVRAGY